MVQKVRAPARLFLSFTLDIVTRQNEGSIEHCVVRAFIVLKRN